MVSPPATSEVGVHAAGDTKSEHFELAGVGKLNEKHFLAFFSVIVNTIISVITKVLQQK
jgi:hypothetical protein